MSAPSWIAYAPTDLFPIQNLPYGVCVHPVSGEHHCCTRVGDTLIDLHLLSLHSRTTSRMFTQDAEALMGLTLETGTWNAFMSKGQPVWSALRQQLTHLLSSDCPTLRDDAKARSIVLYPVQGVQMVLPATIGDYTDFYSSKEHATNLGKMFRPDQEPLLPNWLWLPVGYHGRASSIVVSGVDVVRPSGQSRPDPNAPPKFGPSQRVDMEIEVAAWIGTGNAQGTQISEADALSHVFGLSVFNDWSARDIQPWEYVPLGPFLAKNFASTISPWIVSLLALEPFFTAAPEQDPAPMDYLKRSHPERSAINMKLFADFGLSSGESLRVTSTNYAYMYWTLSQQIAHHTVNGCNLRPGDVLASGTISGPTKDSWGSLIECTARGTEKITFPSGAVRTFVEDGDSITLTAECSAEHVPYRIGFGEASAKVVASSSSS